MVKKYEDEVELKIYRVGRDVAYLRKYGNITRGTMIVNERTRYDRLSYESVDKAIGDAVVAFRQSQRREDHD